MAACQGTKVSRAPGWGRRRRAAEVSPGLSSILQVTVSSPLRPLSSLSSFDTGAGISSSWKFGFSTPAASASPWHNSEEL